MKSENYKNIILAISIVLMVGVNFGKDIKVLMVSVVNPSEVELSEKSLVTHPIIYLIRSPRTLN